MARIETEEKNGITIVKVGCDLDFEKTVWLRGELCELLKKKKHKLILNMTKVEIISSYTAGVFVAFRRDLNKEKGDLKFSNLQARVQYAFEATRINELVDVFITEEEAIKSFEEK
jgi:anti-sigma B factor antagonist